MSRRQRQQPSRERRQRRRRWPCCSDRRIFRRGERMIHRRVFLKHGGMALVSLGLAPEFLARTAAASNPRQRVLVTIFQRGAVDGLNMIVPFGERDYYAA